MHLYHADIIARNILNELTPFCVPDHCRIAGSVRRRKEEVKDIECVCLPAKSVFKETNLFSEVVSTREIIHPEFERLVRSYGEIKKGKFGGNYMQIEMRHNIEGTQHIINLDLFMPRPEDFWRQFVIRTGSAEFVRRFISAKWVANGWCGINGHLYLQKDCTYSIGADGKKVWKLKDPNVDHFQPPVWKSEREFFNWLGASWPQFGQPNQRNL